MFSFDASARTEMIQLNGPPTAFYEPNFITEDEEKRLIDSVYNAPKPKWQQLSNRRLQNWGGFPHLKGMIPEPIPCWLMQYVNKVHSLGLFGEKKPNHVLVNEYLPGQGIMPHTDGPLFHPVITTISLGSHTVLNFHEKMNNEVNSDDTADKTTGSKEKVMSVLLEPRSLFVVMNDLYENYLHSIDELRTDEVTESTLHFGAYNIGDVLHRQTRISLTIRHVPKTTKAKILLGRRT